MKMTGMGVLFCVLFALLPFVIWTQLYYGSINAKFFLVVGAADVALLLAAYRYWRGGSAPFLRNRPLLFALILALAVGYVSALTGFYTEFSLWSDILRSTGLLFLTHVALLAFLAGEYLTARDWSLVRRVVAVTGGVFGILSLVGVEGLGYMGKFLWINIGINGLTFGNSTFAGVYLVLALLLGLIELARLHGEENSGEKRAALWRKILTGGVVFTMLSPVLSNVGIFFGKTPLSSVFAHPGLVLGSARASSATAFATLLFLGGRRLILRYARGQFLARAKVAWSAAWLLGMILGITLLFTPGSFVQRAYVEASSAARLYVWHSGWEAFLERPMLGWGPENFAAAFESHINPRLYRAENFGEPWFDRAHNVFIDTLVAEGVLGFAASVLLAFAYLLVVRRAYRRGAILEHEALLLAMLVPAHLLQLQTGFDTVSSYTLLGLFLGYALHLERLGAGAEPLAHRDTSRSVAAVLPAVFAIVLPIVLAVAALISAKFVLFDEYVRQHALFNVAGARDEASQLAAIRTAAQRTSNFEGLRVSTAALIKGGLAKVAQSNDPKLVKAILVRLQIYEEAYRRYLDAAPEYYRARMNYAYLLIVETALGENRLDDAERIVEESYPLSPHNPLTYALHSIILLYKGDVAGAKAKIEESYALDPEIGFTKQVRMYVSEQAARFPDVSLLKLENL
jgi:hypothetical protein